MDSSIEKFAKVSPAIRDLIKENEELKYQLKFQVESLKAQLADSQAETEKALEFKRRFFEFIELHCAPVAVGR